MRRASAPPGPLRSSQPSSTRWAASTRPSSAETPSPTTPCAWAAPGPEASARSVPRSALARIALAFAAREADAELEVDALHAARSELHAPRARREARVPGVQRV